VPCSRQQQGTQAIQNATVVQPELTVPTKHNVCVCFEQGSWQASALPGSRRCPRSHPNMNGRGLTSSCSSGAGQLCGELCEQLCSSRHGWGVLPVPLPVPSPSCGVTRVR
jgi:hypothetical protein